MSRPKIPTINWKKELEVLDSYIRSKGGVIHIRTTEDSPSSAFCKALRSIMENASWEKQWITIQFDGDNSSTHYLNDMLDQLEISLKLEPIEVANTGFGIHVGNEISAEGNVEVSDVKISVNEGTNLRRERVQRIVNLIRQDADKIRLAIILFNTDSENTNKNELKNFKSWFLDHGLLDLVSAGFLLIGFSHRSSDTSNWLPEPDEVIDLPSTYDEMSEAHAKEDIANFLLSNGFAETIEEAVGKSMGIVASYPYPKDLHANFAGILARFSAWQ